MISVFNSLLKTNNGSNPNSHFGLNHQQILQLQQQYQQRHRQLQLGSHTMAHYPLKRPHEDLNSSDHTPSCLPSSTSSLCDNQLQQSFAYVDNNSHQFSQHTQSYLTSYTSSSDTYKKAKFNFQMSNNNNNIITNNNNNNNVSSPPLSVQNNYLAIRNLPSDATDADINQLLTMVTCNPATVLSMIICKINNQAIVEVIDESTAIAIVNYFQQNSAQIVGQNVAIQLSNLHEFKSQQQQQQKLQSQVVHYPASDSLAVIPSVNSIPEEVSNFNGNCNNTTVLRVIVENLIYPITIDILYVLFQTYGKVLKIVTFIKNGIFQALIQYSDAANAKKAKALLDGQHIYNNCCTLRIEYSKMAMLKVKYNNEKSRDYTNTSLPPYDFADAASAAIAVNGANLTIMPATTEQATVAAVNSPMGGFMTGTAPFATAIPGTTPNDFLFLTNQARLPRSAYPFTATTATDSSNFLAAVAAAAASSGNPFVTATPLAGTPYAAAIAAANNALGSLAFATNPHLNSGNPVLTTLPNSTFLKAGHTLGTCLHVSNLNEQLLILHPIYNKLKEILIGVYGDVLRVKILYNKKDSALIQMAEIQQAQLAIMHMDKLRVFGKNIKVTLSKHQTVQMPKEGQPDAGLTKDYSQSALHRFKKPGSKNYSNIYPPSATLHLSNIPASITEENIREYFITNGFNVKAFKFFPKDNKMALIQMPTLEEAVMALIKMHNYQLSESNHLRVSFSKSSI